MNLYRLKTATAALMLLLIATFSSGTKITLKDDSNPAAHTNTIAHHHEENHHTTTTTGKSLNLRGTKNDETNTDHEIDTRSLQGVTNTYVLKIRTGSETNAGTNSKVKFTIYGDKGNTGPLEITKNFDTESIVEIELQGMDVGEVKYIKVDHVGDVGVVWSCSSNWFIDSITIRSWNFDEKFAKINQWVDTGKSIYANFDGYPQDYKIVIQTGDVADAGTDSNIYINIYGNLGETGEYRLNGLIEGDAFERNKQDTVTLTDILNVGTIDKVQIRSDGSGPWSGWYLTSVTVNGEYAKFERWIDEGSYVSSISSPPKKYSIMVQTGDVSDAGTDSNIYITIEGDKGKTQETRLNGYINHDAFERNTKEYVTLTLDDVGKLTKVFIRSDGSGAWSGWYLSNVSVDDKSAAFNRWVDDETVSAPLKGDDVEPTPSCMSGETGVVVLEENNIPKGDSVVVKVRDLTTNDSIQGLDENRQPTTCKIEAVGNFGVGPVYGNYTDGHYILNPDTGNIEQHGKGQPMSVVDKYIVVTSCPLGVDESGTGFTPFDSDFFGDLAKEMSWTDYLLLHKAILRVVRATGGFWFHGSSYADMMFLHSHAPVVCSTMLKCMKDHEDCQEFEVASQVFIERALAEPARKKAYEAFGNIGQHRELGSASATVSAGGSVRRK